MSKAAKIDKKKGPVSIETQELHEPITHPEPDIHTTSHGIKSVLFKPPGEFTRGLPKEDMVANITYLKSLIGDTRTTKNNRLRQIKEYRRECLENIIHKIYIKIDNLYGGDRSELFPRDICPVSFLFSSLYEMRGSELTEDGRPSNILWIIVSALLEHPRILTFMDGLTQKKLFHEPLPDGSFKLKTFFWCRLSDTTGDESASANVPENYETTTTVEHTEYKAELTLTRGLFTVQAANKCFFPLKRQETLKYMGGWMGKVQDGGKVTSDWQEEKEKTVFSVKVGKEYRESPSFAIDIPIEAVVYRIQENYEHSHFLPDVIGCENLLSLILLVEHELVHVAYGIYDNEGNYGANTELATLQTYNDLLVPETEREKNGKKGKRKGKRKGKSDKGPRLIDGITDENGHGVIFVEWLNILFGHIGHLSPVDRLNQYLSASDVVEKINDLMKNPKMVAMKNEYDLLLATRLELPDDEDLGGGGCKTIRKRRKTKRKRRRKLRKTRRKTRRKKRRKKRRKTRRKTR